MCIELDGDTSRKIQIEGKGRAIQRGLYFLHEALNDRLPMIEEIDRRNLLVSFVEPYQALVGTLVGALNLRNL